MGLPRVAAGIRYGHERLDWGHAMSVDTMAYIHMKVGRTLKNQVLDPAKFTLINDERGRAQRVRVKRGTRFQVGERLGTVNAMHHVHLVYQPGTGDVNPLSLPFAGLTDSIVPTIDGIGLYDQNGTHLNGDIEVLQPVKRKGKRGGTRMVKRLVKRTGPLIVSRAAGPLSIVVEAYDQTDGNEARRKLGLYKVGYQILHADGTPVAGYETPLMNIEFNRLPPDDESVKVAYAPASGITVHGNARTRYLYVVTNQVRDGKAKTGMWDPATLAPGDYLIRISAADYLGNQAREGRDLAITVQ